MNYMLWDTNVGFEALHGEVSISTWVTVTRGLCVSTKYVLLETCLTNVLIYLPSRCTHGVTKKQIYRDTNACNLCLFCVLL